MRKRILTVEDVPLVRAVMKRALTCAGYEVVEAVDGEDALAKLEGTPVSLIVTDLNMPNLDGLGLIRAVRRDPVHCCTPIVVVTAETDDSKRDEGMAVGATEWILKSSTPDEWVDVVNRLAL